MPPDSRRRTGAAGEGSAPDGGLSRGQVLRGGTAGAAAIAAGLLARPDKAGADGAQPTIVNPDSLRAAGDPDDTSSLNAALATGAYVMLTRGKTYTVSSPLNMSLAGQTLDGNGACLKRANQSGTTEWNTVMITAPDCRVRDLEFDGNKANYPIANWLTTNEVRIEAGGDRAVIERCYIHDFPGEGIQQGNADDVAVIRNVLVNGNGNGIHYGSSSRVYKGGKVALNTVKNVNLNPAVGHAEGAVVLSNGVGDFLVQGNYLENAIAGVGSIDSSDNLDITISGNTIRSMSGSAIEGDNPLGTAATNVLIEHNRIYDSGNVVVSSQDPTSSAVPARWTIRGNLLWNTGVSGNYAQWVIVEGNVFAGGGASATYVNMAGVKRLTVAGNQFDAGQIAVNVGGGFDTVAVKGNVLSGQSSRAVNAYAGGGIGMSITDNVVSACGDRGIRIAVDKATVKGNDVTMAGGTGGVVVSGNYNVIANNTVRAGSATYSIQVAIGSISNVVRENQTDKTVSDSGTKTDKSGNAQLAG